MAIVLVQCNNNKNELSKKEKDFAIAHLNKSKKDLLEITKDLSEVQLHYTIDETSWSIAQCTEHITIFTNKIFDILEESLELPADPERRKDVKFSDEELMAFVQNRTNKAKTQEDFEPRKTYGNHAETIKLYIEKLEKHVDFLQSTKDDLRNHYVNFGTVDAYQMFLYMAAHTNRHIAQIKEIKNHINFPKN